MIFTETGIRSLYEKSLAEALEKLASLEVAEGRRPNAGGLNGWVFEETVRFCLSRELDGLGLHPDIQEQVCLAGRARIDLVVGKAAIELKAAGSFGAGDSKYVAYRKTVEEHGWVYLYVTLGETHPPYREATETTFGAEHSFFLDALGDWERFVRVVAGLLE